MTALLALVLSFGYLPGFPEPPIEYTLLDQLTSLQQSSTERPPAKSGSYLYQCRDVAGPELHDPYVGASSSCMVDIRDLDGQRRRSSEGGSEERGIRIGGQQAVDQKSALIRPQHFDDAGLNVERGLGQASRATHLESEEAHRTHVLDKERHPRTRGIDRVAGNTQAPHLLPVIGSCGEQRNRRAEKCNEGHGDRNQGRREGGTVVGILLRLVAIAGITIWTLGTIAIWIGIACYWGSRSLLIGVIIASFCIAGIGIFWALHI